jgi:iron(III) transport system substrate-binding protein
MIDKEQNNATAQRKPRALLQTLIRKRTCLWALPLVISAVAVVSHAAGSAPGSQPGWQQEWEKTLAAAKREGKVSMAGPPGAERRQGLVEPFQAAFPGIVVNFIGAAGGPHVTRIMNERKAGQYTTDVYMGGPSPAVEVLVPAGAFEPLESALILPDVKDPTKWYGPTGEGGLDFVDREERFYLAFGRSVNDAFVYNSNLVDPAEFQSYWDLTKPQWRGKIVMYDPTVPGPGTGRISFYYSHGPLGTSFLKALLNPEHKVVFSRDDRQMTEWVGRGQYAIGIGIGWEVINVFANVLPIKSLDPVRLKEGGYTASGWHNIALVKRAPQPNAARIYINWLLSREGQTQYSKISKEVSARLDVPTDHVHPVSVPRRGVKYMRTYDWNILQAREEATAFVRKVVGR